MSLQECMEVISHREYLLWMEWLRIQWNSPSRNDHYLMAIALELRTIQQMFSETPRPYSLDHMKVKFNFRKIRKGKPLPGTLTQEDIIKIRQSYHMAAVGIDPITGKPMRRERSGPVMLPRGDQSTPPQPLPLEVKRRRQRGLDKDTDTNPPPSSRDKET